ncbi:MAG: hypothetical protein PHX27_03405 [Candidatus ainarchaeum sp.]|nr:hypothetical protein [Candidatus ainarchaeum sp.]
MVSFDEWQKIDLRVGLIEDVIIVEGKDKLYKLLVDFGEEKKIVVSGIRKYYSIDELKGKKVSFVYNLAPVRIAGIDSCAMILGAINIEGEYKLCFADDSIKQGTKLE